MSFTNPAFRIPRRTVEQPRGEAGLWVKFPPMVADRESPPTPELLDFSAFPDFPIADPPTPAVNPVIQVMVNAGLMDKVRDRGVLFTDLMHGMRIPTWDNRPRDLMYFLFRQKDTLLADGNFPGPTIRIPRGALFHANSQGHGPPPHTIHWHGIEPTPMNDGVGHCSMEIGRYLYQFQPNFIGFYFYHCHRNTVQHFEFGLYGALIICTPDSFFATLADPTVPIGAGRDRKFRVQANLTGTPLAFLQDNFNPLETADPGPNPGDVDLTFPTDPHAFTVPIDVEVLWVLDDRDSVWSDFAPGARDFFPRFGNRPGLNERWFRGFFNDYNADYWFVTGVPVPAARVDKGGTGIGTINPLAPLPVGGIGGVDVTAFGGEIPPSLNSGRGVDGAGNPVPFARTQIAVNAQVGHTIAFRVLDAAYNSVRVFFPMDVVIIATDGRTLGVPPFGNYNNAFVLPAGVPIVLCTARRFVALARFDAPFSGFATVEFYDSQGVTPVGGDVPGSLPVLMGEKLMTARIPINIT